MSFFYQDTPGSSDTSGNRFCISFFENDPGNPTPSQLRVFVMTPGNTPVAFIVRNIGGIIAEDTVQPGEVKNVTIPSDNEIDTATLGSRLTKTIVIRTNNVNDSIQVFGFSDNQDTADVFLAVPIRREEGITSYDYAQISTSIEGGVRESQFAVAVCDVDDADTDSATFFASQEIADDTTVAIRVKQKSRGGVIITRAGSNAIGLREYDTAIVFSPRDLTGFRVSSGTPRGMMIGHACGQIPFNVPTSDHMIEQSPPSYTWGYHFISSPLQLRITGYLIKIIPRYRDATTTVTRFCEGDSSETTQQLSGDGTIIDITSTVNCYFRTSRPAAVVQFAKGQQSDDDADPLRTVFDIGDPAMSWLPPVGQYINKITFYTGFMTTFGSYTYGEYVNIIVPADYYNASMIKLDGSASLEWTEIKCSPSEVCAYNASTRLQNGIHTVQHDNPDGRLSAIVYGWDQEEGYMYPGGFAMEPIGGTEFECMIVLCDCT